MSIVRRFDMRLGAALLSAALALSAAGADAAEQAIIILDASGSMWGQIDGTPKIVIARDVLDRTVGAGASDAYIGFMAYGHREKGSCTDIELLYAPAPSSGAEIAGTARDLNPKGKTPLTEAVRQAAEALAYTERKATVILITDGLETCNADPCALARQLEASGVDFTTHVVGFGLSPEEGQQVACLADETGGAYIQASDADGLADALATSVAEASLPTPTVPTEVAGEIAGMPSASLDAPLAVEIGAEFTVAWFGPGEVYDHIWIFDPGADRRVRGRRLSTSPDYEARTVDLTAPSSPGGYELRYYHGDPAVLIASRAINVVEAPVSLEAPPGVAIGTTFHTSWIGPGGDRDFVDLYDEASSTALGVARLVNHDFANRRVRFIAPIEPGFYLLRYLDGVSRSVLATRQVEVLPAAVGLDAPDAVAAGSLFKVVWEGPGAFQDRVEIYDAAADTVVASKRLVNDDYENRTATLKAPATAGSYVLRYFNGASRSVLFERPLAVE